MIKSIIPRKAIPAIAFLLTLGSLSHALEFDTYQGLRSNTATYNENEIALIKGRNDLNDGLGGSFIRVQSSTDNDGTILVDNASQTWERVITGPLNILWFGADPKEDSNDDDSAALNAAIAYGDIGNGSGSKPRIYIPTGYYEIQNELNILDGPVEIYGDGTGSRLITGNSSLNAIMTTTTTSNRPTHVHIHHLRFNGKNIGSAIALDFKGKTLTRCKFNNLEIYNFKGGGFRSVASNDNGIVGTDTSLTLSKLYISNIAGHGIEISGNVGTVLRDNYIGAITAADKAAYRIHKGRVTMIACNGTSSQSHAQAYWGWFGSKNDPNDLDNYPLGWQLCTPTMIGCNVEHFQGAGIKLEATATINAHGVSFFPATSTTARAIDKVSSSEIRQPGYIGAGCNFNDPSKYEQNEPLHCGDGFFNHISMTQKTYYNHDLGDKVKIATFGIDTDENGDTYLSTQNLLIDDGVMRFESNNASANLALSSGALSTEANISIGEQLLLNYDENVSATITVNENSEIEFNSTIKAPELEADGITLDSNFLNSLVQTGSSPIFGNSLVIGDPNATHMTLTSSSFSSEGITYTLDSSGLQFDGTLNTRKIELNDGNGSDASLSLNDLTGQIEFDKPIKTSYIVIGNTIVGESYFTDFTLADNDETITGGWEFSSPIVLSEAEIDIIGTSTSLSLAKGAYFEKIEKFDSPFQSYSRQYSQSFKNPDLANAIELFSVDLSDENNPTNSAYRGIVKVSMDILIYEHGYDGGYFTGKFEFHLGNFSGGTQTNYHINDSYVTVDKVTRKGSDNGSPYTDFDMNFDIEQGTGDYLGKFYKVSISTPQGTQTNPFITWTGEGGMIIDYDVQYIGTNRVEPFSLLD